VSPEFAEELARVRRDARELYSMAELDAAIDQMAAAITAAHGEHDPLLLTVMNGGVVLAGRLLTRLDFPLEIDYLHATRYRGETAGSDLQWRVAPAASLKDRHVIILDDILDVGTTLLAVIDACKAQGAASVSTAVLVDKVHDRKARPGLKADYTGVEAEDAYLFGAGMDYRGYWRNAPGIFAVSE
jgi:hypoxanthine phosphoribosyltransferase